MPNYSDLLQNARTARVIHRVAPVAGEHLRALEGPFGKLPPDYVAFLREIGAGPLGHDQYMIYTGLVTAEEIFGDVPETFSELLLFGDDMQGLSHAFHRASWSVVEVDSTDMSVITVAPSFAAFVRSKIIQLFGRDIEA